MLRLFGFLQRLREDAGGNTLAICAAAIIPLTAIIGSALDLSDAYMTRQRLQNACDASVLAARQYMKGTDFNSGVTDEADKFFDFNFPAGTSNVSNLDFSVVQDSAKTTQLNGVASAKVPTSLMRIFGFKNIPIKVDCDATRDTGHNDIMLVLDVTGSMADAPSSGGASKISRLREGAMGLYKALESDDGSITRFGIVPYSHTVNVARSLMNKDILDREGYVGRWWYKYCDYNSKKKTYSNCVDQSQDIEPQSGVQGNKYIYNVQMVLSDPNPRVVPVQYSYWNNAHGYNQGNTEGFRTSGDPDSPNQGGCIEERPSVGEGFSLNGLFRIDNTITQADVDTQAGNAGNEPELQFGRYDPFIQRGQSQTGCPSEATTLRTYDSEDAFQTAIDAATKRVTGGTYHDIGMLWGLRFISRTGYFADDNPTERDGIPVNQHIVFMTDGKLDTGKTLYSAYGVQQYQGRVQGCGSGGSGCNAVHIARFQAACSLAKSMGITVWVIALDVTDIDDIKDCATSADHFYTSDGSDLESVFEKIGQGIGNLRLTK